MSEVHITINPFILNGGMSALVKKLWDGAVSENDFIKEAHQQGVSVARIEWELEQLKQTDGVA